MLQLGLERIGKLVVASNLPWRAVHVAGTNGKGSVCSYASRMLRSAGVSVGTFTSPHLIDRWDCISLNGQTISGQQFAELEDEVKRKDQHKNLKCTEFELLTATAFEAFSRARVDVGVVEVGVGGRTDATNVLLDPLATVITSISRDHESLLGNSLTEIAAHKAGIIKPGAPCFADARNPQEVQDVIRNEAAASGAKSLEFISSKILQGRINGLDTSQLADHQLGNLALALAASKQVLASRNIAADDTSLISAAEPSQTRGRLQQLSLAEVTGRQAPTLLDGAHNEQSAHALGRYVDHHLRPDGQPVTWILAASQGKGVEGMYGGVLRVGDRVVTTSFGPVDGMPWVKAVGAEDLALRIQAVCEVEASAVEGVQEALQAASAASDEGPLVVAGSLYLASDVLRLVRAKGGPGVN